MREGFTNEMQLSLRTHKNTDAYQGDGASLSKDSKRNAVPGTATRGAAGATPQEEPGLRGRQGARSG